MYAMAFVRCLLVNAPATILKTSKFKQYLKKTMTMNDNTRIQCLQQNGGRTATYDSQLGYKSTVQRAGMTMIEVY